MKRWLIRNIWLLPPLALALLLVYVTLPDISRPDHQLILIGMALPLGLSVVMTNLAHGKAGRRYALLGIVLAAIPCVLLFMLPSRLGVYRLSYKVLQQHYIGTIPVIVPCMLGAALLVLISACIALFSKNRLPVTKLTIGKRLLRTLLLIVPAAVIFLSWNFLISEQREIGEYIWFQQLLAFTFTLPMLLSILFIDVAHYRGSKGAALWGIFCAAVHVLASLALYYITDTLPTLHEMCKVYVGFSAIAALAELICAIMALVMKRPAPAAGKDAAPVAATPVAAAVAPVAPAPAAPAQPDPTLLAMQQEIAALRQQLAEQQAKSAAAEAAPVTEAVTATETAPVTEDVPVTEDTPAAEAAPAPEAAPAAASAPAPAATPVAAAPAARPAASVAPAPQGPTPLVTYPYEEADLNPGAASAITNPETAERIAQLSQLLAQGVLDNAAYEAAIRATTAGSAPKSRPERIYDDFMRNHVAYAYKSPAGVKFDPLREDMICIEKIKLLVGLKYHDLEVRMIKTFLDAPNSYGTMLRQNVCIVIDDDFNPIFALSPSVGLGSVQNGIQVYTKLAGVK